MKLQEIVKKKLVVDLATTDNAELVRQVQTRLKDLKLLRDIDVDGISGPITLGAWKKFKEAIDQGAPDYITKIGAGSAKVLIERKEPIGGGSEELRALASIDRVTKLFNRRPTPQQYEDLIDCLARFDIITIPRICHFMAQVGHESAGLRYVKELASGRAYEGRRDLGNTVKGDGMKFKGGGVIQLTGRANYTRFANFIGDPQVVAIGVNYVADKYPFSSAGFWWMNAGMNSRIDQGWTVKQVSRRVNGGENGMRDRIRYYNKALTIFK